MPKQGIDINQCNIDDLRLEPLNLLWGGPLLVDRRRKQQRREQKKRHGSDATTALAEQVDSPESVAVSAELPPQPAELVKLPPAADMKIAEDAATKEKGEERRKKKKKKHRDRKKTDSGSEADMSNARTSVKMHRRTHHQRRVREYDNDSCYCCSDTIKKKSKKKSSSGFAAATKCSLCRQRLSSSDNGCTDQEKNGSEDTCKKKKNKQKNEKEEETDRNGEAGKQTSAEGYATVPTARKNGIPADQANDNGDNIDSNVHPFVKDTMPSLPNQKDTHPPNRHDFSSMPCLHYPYQMPAAPGFSRLLYQQYNHDNNFQNYSQYHHSHPEYPAFPYAYTGSSLMMPSMTQSFMPPPTSYQVGIETQRPAFSTDHIGEGPLGISPQNSGTNMAPWNGMDATNEPTAVNTRTGDNRDIRWDDDMNNTQCSGGGNSSGGQELTWTPDDLAVLRRLHSWYITDRWRDLQAAFYNETGRMVDWEVLKSKADQEHSDQERATGKGGNA